MIVYDEDLELSRPAADPEFLAKLAAAGGGGEALRVEQLAGLPEPAGGAADGARRGRRWSCGRTGGRRGGRRSWWRSSWRSRGGVAGVGAAAVVGAEVNRGADLQLAFFLLGKAEEANVKFAPRQKADCKSAPRERPAISRPGPTRPRFSSSLHPAWAVTQPHNGYSCHVGPRLPRTVRDGSPVGRGWYGQGLPYDAMVTRYPDWVSRQSFCSSAFPSAGNCAIYLLDVEWLSCTPTRRDCTVMGSGTHGANRFPSTLLEFAHRRRHASDDGASWANSRAQCGVERNGSPGTLSRT